MSDVNSLLKQVIKEARNIKIPVSRAINPTVSINSRVKRRFGSCKSNAFGHTVEIAERVVSSGEFAIKEILAHEILHTCFGCKNHGERWKRYAARMNEVYGYNISRTTSCEALGIEDDAKPRYILACEKCGVEFKRIKKTRFVEHPEHYHCSCGGKIKRIK